MSDRTPTELADALDALAKRFNAGWHDGIEIDATDIADLCEAAYVLRNTVQQDGSREP